MREQVKTAAVVIKARDFKDSDQMLTLYTLEKGKIQAIVKGVKKSKSKLRGGVQLFSQTNLLINIGTGIPMVLNAETMNTFAPLRDDLFRMSYASYFVDLVDSVVMENDPDREMFIFLLKGLNILAYAPPEPAIRMLELKLLKYLGTTLILDQCIECGTNIDDKYLQIIEGGSICGQCDAVMKNKGRTLLAISQETKKFVDILSDIPVNKLHILKMSNNARQEIEMLLEMQLNQIIGYSLKSKEFLKSITKSSL